MVNLRLTEDGFFRLLEDSSGFRLLELQEAEPKTIKSQILISRDSTKSLSSSDQSKSVSSQDQTKSASSRDQEKGISSQDQSKGATAQDQ